jgi:hypothetical protein
MVAKSLLTWRVAKLRTCWRCANQLPETQCVGLTMLGWLCQKCYDAHPVVCSGCGVRLQPWGLKGGNFAAADSKRSWCRECAEKMGGMK